MTTTSNIAKEKLAIDLKSVISDTEELLKATAGQVDDKIQSARARVEKTLHSASVRMEDLEHAAADKVMEAAKATNQYVHVNPWPSIGVAAGLGLIVGWLIGFGRK